MKTCFKCSFVGEKNLFVKLQNLCKVCHKQYQKEYRQINKDKLKIARQIYYTTNQEAILKNKKEYYNKNRDYQLNFMKQYYWKNKEIISKYRKNYVENNRFKIRNYHKNYRKNKVRKDPVFKLRVNCSRLVHFILKKNKTNLSILNYLPYTMKELKFHLEKQFDNKMSWSNYGSYWHLDHIIPQSLLLYTSMEDDNFKKCWALENLRPLEAIENMKKGNRLI